MALFIEKYNLLFLCVGKTGSTSISTTLFQSFKSAWVPIDHIWHHNQILVDYKHSTLKQLVSHNIFDVDKLQSINILLTTRNPYACVLLTYRFFKKCFNILEENGEYSPDWIFARRDFFEEIGKNTFDEYIYNKFRGKQSVYKKYIEGFENFSNIKIIRIENINPEITEYLHDIGIKKRISPTTQISRYLT